VHPTTPVTPPFVTVTTLYDISSTAVPPRHSGASQLVLILVFDQCLLGHIAGRAGLEAGKASRGFDQLCLAVHIVGTVTAVDILNDGDSI